MRRETAKQRSPHDNSKAHRTPSQADEERERLPSRAIDHSPAGQRDVGRLTPADALRLQRMIGNRATSRLLQRRLSQQPAPPPVAVSPAPGVNVQRTLSESKAASALKTILLTHGLSTEYGEMWKSKDIQRIAKEVGDMPDTDKDNVKSRLTSHPDIKDLLLPHRMALEPGKDSEFSDKDMQIVFDAYKRLLFFHATKYVDDVFAKGLDPNFGGKEGGMSDERSTVGKREANIAGSKGHVYLSRKESEAKQYAKDGAKMVHVLVPTAMQGGLEVDPDSLTGVYGSEMLKGVAKPSGEINWWAELYLKKEMDSKWKKIDVPHITLVPAIFKKLVDTGAIRALGG